MSYTSPDNLNKQDRGTPDWDVELNSNFDKIQAALTARSLTSHDHEGEAPGDAALKPAVSDSMQFVSPEGDDDNDGLSWGSAKLTILGAYEALPIGGGTIYFASGVQMRPDATKGLWFWGSQAGGRPADWLEARPLNLVGVPTHQPGLPTGGPLATLIGGSYPFKFMYDSTQQRFENISVDNATVAVRMGVADDGTRWDGGISQTVQKVFSNCQFRVAQVAGNGPCIDVGSNVFWIWFEHCVMVANEQELVAADKRSCVHIDPTTAGGSGLIQLRDSNFAGGGGLRYKSGGVGGLRVFMENITTEASTSGAVPFSQQPCFELIKSGADLTGFNTIRNVEIADAFAAEPAVRVDPAVDPRVCLVENVGLGVGLEGPMTLIGGKVEPGRGSPPRNGMIGFQGGRLFGRHDSARRLFAPVSTLYANLVSQDTSTWSARSGSAVVTTGKAAPNGTTEAAELSSVSGLQERQVYRANTALAVGDYIIAGVWAREVEGVAIGAIQMSLIGTGWTFDTAPIPGGAVSMGSPYESEQWEWHSVIARVATAGGGANEVIFGLRCTPEAPMEYFAPVLFKVPVATVSLDELHELRLHSSTWVDGAPVGSISTLRGQKFITHGGLGVGNAVAATTPGSVVKKMEVFDAAGASLGYVPIYSAIT
jgi:hypothetical protein